MHPTRYQNAPRETRWGAVVLQFACFASIPSAAITTFKLRAKNALTAVCSAYGFPTLDLLLNGLPFIRVNDRLVAVLDIVLRHFALVDLPFLGQKICRKALLRRNKRFDTIQLFLSASLKWVHAWVQGRKSAVLSRFLMNPFEPTIRIPKP